MTETPKPRGKGRPRKYQTADEAYEALKQQNREWRARNKDHLRARKMTICEIKIERKEQLEEIERMHQLFRAAMSNSPPEEVIRYLTDNGLGEYIWGSST